MAGNYDNYSNDRCEQQTSNNRLNHNGAYPNTRETTWSLSEAHSHQRQSISGSGATMQMNGDFMQSPLVTWAQTLLDESCDFQELCNGTFLNRAWLQIDPNPAYHFNEKCTESSPIQESILLEHHAINQSQISTLQNQQLTRRQQQLSRIRALWTLLNNVRTFYENVLDQVLVMRLPDVVNIALAASGDENGDFSCLSKCLLNASLDEDIRSFLLLILGCAVQCDQKELFIEKIKQLDIGVQHAIVESIQQITDNPDSVFLVNEWASPPKDDNEKDRLYAIFISHISRLSKERDQLYQRVVDLSCEIVNLSTSTFSIGQDGSQSLSLTGGQSSGTNQLTRRSLSNSSLNNAIFMDSQLSKSHALVELADAKSRLRRLQQELDEKNEALAEAKEAFEQSKLTCNKLRTENLELSQEVRNAKAYRDEIDVLNERVRKVDRLESEAVKYREKLNELDFFKSRVEELREDNRILVDTKAMLEEQLDSARKRSEKIPELEERILKVSAYGNELNLQRELDKNQIERLIEELAHLKQEKKAANEELSKVQTELADLKQQARFDAETRKSEEGASLMDQINQDNHKRLLKLEHENKKLQNVIDDYQASYVDIDSLISLVGATIVPVSLSQEDEGQRLSEGQCDSGCFSSAKSKAEKLNELRDYVDRLRAAQAALKSAETSKNDLENMNSELKNQLTENCRKIDDTERQLTAQSNECLRLQRSIEQKSKLIERLDVELQSCRTEICTLEANSNNSKQMLKKLNELEIVMSSIESERDRLEQANRSIEKEICRLKSIIQAKDDLIDQSTSKIDTLETDYRRAKKELESQTIICNRARDLELENKDLTNAKVVAMSTLSSLQTELIEEKLAVQRHSADLESIKDVIDKYLSEIKLEKTIDDSLPVVIHRCLKSKREDFDNFQELLSGVKAQNVELQALVDSLKQQLSLAESTRNDSEVLAELQLKNQTLEDELKAIKDDLGSERDTQSLITGQLSEARENFSQIYAKYTELQSESAKWQVESSLLKSQNSSLEAQTCDLRDEMLNIQQSIQQLQTKCHEYEQSHQNLMNDYESLQNIHQQLSVDYDHLNQSHGIMKQTNKSLKNDNKILENELQATISKTNTELASLREQMEAGDGDEEMLKGRITSLQEENKNLAEELSRMQNEHKMLQNLYKKLRSENNELKLKYTELQGELAECQDRMNSMQTEMSKLTNYCDFVKMTDTALDTHRKKLNAHSSTLMAQYNELVNDILKNGGFNPEYVQKMKDLKLKGDRYMKYMGKYDSFDGQIQKDIVLGENSNTTGGLDHSIASPGTTSATQSLPERDVIYGRLWEAETGSLASNVLLRQYSLNSNQITKNSPPRIPPRTGVMSGPMTPTRGVLQNVAIQQINSHETVIEVGSAGHVMDNKMSINVSTRGNVSTSTSATTHSSASTVKNGIELMNVESQCAKLQIYQSPKPSQPTFMRGSFKSSSVNYGNVLRQNSKHSHYSPNSAQHPTGLKSLTSQKAIQLNRNIGFHLSNSPAVPAASAAVVGCTSPAQSSLSSPMRSIYQNHQNNVHLNNKPTTTIIGTTQSFHSDTSNSSHSPQDFERIIVENGKKRDPTVDGQIGSVSGSVNSPEVEQNPKSHAIWYEYGCV